MSDGVPTSTSTAATSSTSAEIKAVLYSSFSKSGIEASLKAQLRLELIQLFKKQSGITSKVETSKESSITLNALNSLIMDHFQRNNYRYSLSVFLPECGLQPTQILSREDILKVFHLDTIKHSMTTTSTTTSTNHTYGLLEHVLCNLYTLKAHCVDKDTQTEHVKETLDKKLKTLDEELLLRTESERLQPARSFEERMLKFERECEEKYSNMYEDKMARFKANEVSKIKLEEARKNREQMDKWIEDCEKSYAQRADKLKQREEELLDTVRRKERELAKEDYEQRQRLLKEMEQFQIRQDELSRQKELNARELKMQHEKIQEREAALMFKLSEMESAKVTWSHEKELMQREKMEMLHSLESKLKTERDQLVAAKLSELQQLEARHKHDIQLLELAWKQERDSLLKLGSARNDNDLQHTWRKDREDLLVSTLQQIEAIKHQAAKEKQDLIDQHKYAEKEWIRERDDLLRSLRNTTTTTNNYNPNANMDNTVNNLLKLLQQQRPQPNEDIQEIIDELTEDYEAKLRMEHATWRIKEQDLRNENSKLRDKLEEAEHQAEIYRRSLEDEQLKILKIERELTDTKMLLQQTQKAFHVQSSQLLPSKQEFQVFNSHPTNSGSYGLLSTIPHIPSSTKPTDSLPPSIVPVRTQKENRNRITNTFDMAELEEQDKLIEQSYKNFMEPTSMPPAPTHVKSTFALPNTEATIPIASQVYNMTPSSHLASVDTPQSASPNMLISTNVLAAPSDKTDSATKLSTKKESIQPEPAKLPDMQAQLDEEKERQAKRNLQLEEEELERRRREQQRAEEEKERQEREQRYLLERQMLEKQRELQLQEEQRKKEEQKRQHEALEQAKREEELRKKKEEQERAKKEAEKETPEQKREREEKERIIAETLARREKQRQQAQSELKAAKKTSKYSDSDPEDDDFDLDALDFDDDL